MTAKENRISVRLGTDDLMVIKTQAEQIGLSVSEYIRQKTISGISQVLYDPEIRELIREIHADMRKAATSIQRLAAGNDGNSTTRLALEMAEQQLLRLNEKMAYIMDSLKECMAHGGS